MIHANLAATPKSKSLVALKIAPVLIFNGTTALPGCPSQLIYNSPNDLVLQTILIGWKVIEP